jgi:hypothetical protein
MQAFSGLDLLKVWEYGINRAPLGRALLMLTEPLPEVSWDNLADWPLGRRNRALLELRRSCFGNCVHGWVACGQCGEKLEFTLDGRDLSRATTDVPSAGVVVNGRPFRLPTSRDLAFAAGDPDPAKGPIRLIECCCLSPVKARDWSAEELQEIGSELSRADPFAEIRLGLDCPGCGNAWEETLDIASFFWEEIEAQARRLLFEVHTLTLAYGWSEVDILSLSQARRTAYVSLVQA